MKLRLLTSLLTPILILTVVSADPTPIPTPRPSAHPSLPLTTIVRPTISAQEWQEMNLARAKAMKDNPDLLAKAQALGMKMRAFQEKLNAAMLKEDPQIAPILDQLEHRINPIQVGPKLQPTLTPSTFGH